MTLQSPTVHVAMSRPKVESLTHPTLEDAMPEAGRQTCVHIISVNLCSHWTNLLWSSDAAYINPKSCEFCKSNGRNLILCFDGTSNQFGENVLSFIFLLVTPRLTASPAEHKRYWTLFPYYQGRHPGYLLQQRNRHLCKTLMAFIHVFETSCGEQIWSRHCLVLVLISLHHFYWSYILFFFRNFERVILAGYRWLSDKYVDGDKIFLFGWALPFTFANCANGVGYPGFSRGAYQVRVLAGMIERVRLTWNPETVFSDFLFTNKDRTYLARKRRTDPVVCFLRCLGLPFIWWDSFQRIRAVRWSSSQGITSGGKWTGGAPDQVSEESQEVNEYGQTLQGHVFETECKGPLYRCLVCFKYFLCSCISDNIWNRDTVSSVGVIRGKSLPGTNEFDPDSVCYFRHALALDERRVKFLPEYVCGGETYDSSRVKEVWFAGCHSDMCVSSFSYARISNGCWHAAAAVQRRIQNWIMPLFPLSGWEMKLSLLVCGLGLPQWLLIPRN